MSQARHMSGLGIKERKPTISMRVTLYTVYWTQYTVLLFNDDTDNCNHPGNRPYENTVARRAREENFWLPDAKVWLPAGTGQGICRTLLRAPADVTKN